MFVNICANACLCVCCVCLTYANRWYWVEVRKPERLPRLPQRQESLMPDSTISSLRKKLVGHFGPINSLAFHPDGKRWALIRV